MKKLLTSILILALCIVEIHATETVTSPDGRNTFSFSQENGLLHHLKRWENNSGTLGDGDLYRQPPLRECSRNT